MPKYQIAPTKSGLFLLLTAMAQFFLTWGKPPEYEKVLYAALTGSGCPCF